MMTLKSFLLQDRSTSTVRNYLFEIDRFTQYLGQENAQNAGYKEVMNYLVYLRSKYDNPGTINRILYAIKQYYFYLIAIGKRTDHPCRYLKLKDDQYKDIQVQDLLSPGELNLLLQRKERYEILTIRNQVIMSLLVDQALLIKEMIHLNIEDVDLQNGQIYIHPTYHTNVPIGVQQSLAVIW